MATGRGVGVCVVTTTEVKPAQRHKLSYKILTGSGLVGVQDHQSCSCRSTDAATTACIDFLQLCARVQPRGQQVQKQIPSRSLTAFQCEYVHSRWYCFIEAIVLWLSSKSMLLDSEGRRTSRGEGLMMFHQSGTARISCGSPEV